MRLIISLLFLLGGITSARGQDRDCNVPINKKRIVTNANLEYFVKRLKEDSYTISRDKHMMPHYIKGTVECLLDTMANPGEAWNSSCAFLPNRPDSELVLFATNTLNDIFLIMYRTGGMWTCEHLMLLKLENKGFKPGKLKAVEDVWIGHGLFKGHSITDIVKFIKKNKGSGKGDEEDVYY
ncbi:MAG: hypothetical protein EOP56_05410 [Sphingobacteriales bacterium]|nr:MAG: hypothetical protein EOP56_05410 [Sphingobacteriales bacterium]